MLPGFKRRMQWFLDNKPDLREHIRIVDVPGKGTRRLLSIVNCDHLGSVLRYMLDESEFLSPYGVRALSRVHRDAPFMLEANAMSHRVDYEPAESSSGLFGGNSNWRGPIWFPVNFLLIESAEIPSLSRRHLPSRISLRLRPEEEPLGGIGGTLPPAFTHFPARWQRAPSGIRRSRENPDRSFLARPCSVPRIFSRRYRRRPGRQSSDRLDRPCREINRAKR